MLGLLKDSYNKMVNTKLFSGNPYMVVKCCQMIPKCTDFIELLDVFSIIGHFLLISKRMIGFSLSIGSLKMNFIGRL